MIVRARLLPVPTHLAQADYANDTATRASYQAWVQQMWREKDEQIAELKKLS